MAGALSRLRQRFFRNHHDVEQDVKELREDLGGRDEEKKDVMTRLLKIEQSAEQEKDGG